jgi:hypothetical protein
MLVATDILLANLAALRRTEPDLARRLEVTAPADLQWTELAGGLWSASIQLSGGGLADMSAPARSIALASRYDPLAEAKKLIAAVDLQKHACVVLLGLGLGYHAAALARQMREECVCIVFEPDLAILRAVLERIDHTAWLGRPGIILADPDLDRAGLLTRLEEFSAIMTQGTILVPHAPSRQIHRPELVAFGQMVTEALTFSRTNIATALVNAARTVFNLCNNLPYYAAGADTNPLHQAAAGFPAVCVGAGPSLAKNVDLLRDPKVRQAVVLISSQTTLKPLLDRGIQPDFVTALDYHEISRRFYEGLPPLPGVTLVAQPVANPTILESFPGPVRVTANSFLHRLLGPAAPPIIPVRDGATVAHLSFYLAQHLGCDPIILIGQDLGFSDGLYYCPGTAIHDVWAPELNPHNTLEMMEWQRVVRHRGNLQKLADIDGRSIYSDEQMVTYLKQFERDFAAATQLVLDASEGGLPKARTTRITLRAALAQYATRPVPALPVPARGFDPARLAATRTALARRADEVREIRQLSQNTIPLLQQLREHQKDRARSERLFERVQKNRRRVDELGEAFELINELNTLGAFRRARADRAIYYGEDDQTQRQLHQIERDLDNMDWLIQSCDEALRTFETARLRLAQTPPSCPP